MGNVLIDLEAAKEYVQANYQGDPLLLPLPSGIARDE